MYKIKNIKDESILLKNYSYDSAIIGATKEGSVLYDYDLMIQWLQETEDFSYDDAVEWIEYNTLRAIPYMYNHGIAPTVVYKDEEDEYRDALSCEHVIIEEDVK